MLIEMLFKFEAYSQIWDELFGSNESKAWGQNIRNQEHRFAVVGKSVKSYMVNCYSFDEVD